MSHGLMGFGSIPDDQAPVQVGTLALQDPILSSASVIASTVMRRMAAVPRAQRLSEMVSILNAGQRGLGASAKADFLRRSAALGPRKVDQAMFDAIRAAIADTLVARTLASKPIGLGQTVAEAQGRTSQGVNDANAIFCSYVSGTVGMVGGFVDQLASGGNQNTGAITRSAASGGATAGCNAGQLVIQGQIAAQNAQIAQNGTLQTLAMQQAQDARFMKYTVAAVGIVGTLGVAFLALRK